jgi:phosphopantetheine--protein transferase-like protein
MTRDDSDRIAFFFAAGSRDLTPAPVRHAAYVLYAPVSRDPEVSRHCASVLSDTELQRADRFVTEYDKAQFKQRRAFRRFCGATVLGSSRPLSYIVFEETENGRPYLSDLPDIWFSFSSCRFGFLGAWSSTHGIGVDLEDQTRNLEAVELAHRFFSGAEANAVERVDGLERLRIFFQFWCLKEAALKSIGEGLPFGLDAFEFELDPNLRVVHAPPDHGGPEQFDAHVIEGIDSCCAALVTRSLA